MADGGNPLRQALWPLGLLYGAIGAVRNWTFDAGLRAVIRLTVPVVSIGNLTVGGTGKTPFTIWLATRLQAKGVRVGIVLRGYGGTSSHWPRDVSGDSAPDEVGDRRRAVAVDHDIRCGLQRRAAPFHGRANLREAQQFVVILRIANPNDVVR